MKRKMIGLITFFAEYSILTLICISSCLSSNYMLRFMFLYFLMQAMFGHYNARTKLIWDEVRLLITSHVCFFLASIVMLPVLFSQWDIVFDNFIISFIMLLVSIFLIRFIRIMLRGYVDRILIIGTGVEAASLYDVCKRNRFSMNDVKGFVDINDEDLFPGLHQENQLVETFPTYLAKNLKQTIADLEIDQVIIAVPEISKKHMDVLMGILHGNVKEIEFMPMTNGLLTFDSKVEDFDGLLLISTSRGNTSYIALCLKRLFDIVGALCGCILLAPLTLYVRHTNRKHDDMNPIYFKQERIGRNGNTFQMYKYRTMIPNAEKVLMDLMETNEDIRNEYTTKKKLKDDPRITPAGKVLRGKSLDEFPQFINVLKGEMSLVGPRPYLPREKDDMGMYYSSVVRSKPGITGMWQTHGRSDVSFEDRLKMDDYYYNNWSLWLDVTILVKTIKSVLYGNGAI